ncbi:hypothetical protein Pelo_11576 [Pelomyxa schiedti]|nr:hypothetical protein Pelo_11576 [Pelomyxa schiedti]
MPAILPASFVACLCESVKYAGHVMTAFSIFFPKGDFFWRVYFVFPFVLDLNEGLLIPIDDLEREQLQISLNFLITPSGR